MTMVLQVTMFAPGLDYADVAQLNMYIEYYRKHYMQPDDNPPVGLLLCTEYGQEMVEYLTPFTDPQLFVARYDKQRKDSEILDAGEREHEEMSGTQLSIIR